MKGLRGGGFTGTLGTTLDPPLGISSNPNTHTHKHINTHSHTQAVELGVCSLPNQIYYNDVMNKLNFASFHEKYMTPRYIDKMPK